MKTVLFTSCKLDTQADGIDRHARNDRYLKYYKSIQSKLGFDSIMLSDNASNPHLLMELVEKNETPECPINIMRHGNELVKVGLANYDYPYCWRALYDMRIAIELGAEKIIFLDSDCFVLSQRLADFIRGIDSGWHAFWCKRWNFPESAAHILCKDAFPAFLKFIEPDYMSYNGRCMENTLPFTHVHKEFNTDRFGEQGLPATPDMDLYAQALNHMEMKFYETTP